MPACFTVGQSSDPSVEADVLSDVGSYGKQLGRIGDALAVLLAHFHPRTPLTKEETDAIDDLKEMLAGIADVKQKHGRPVMHPRGAAAPDSVSLAPPQGPAKAPPPPTAAPKPPPARPAGRPRGRS